MQDLEKEIKMEDKQEEKDVTPAPSQDDSNVTDNSDLTPEEFDKQIEEALNGEAQNNSAQNEPEPSDSVGEGLDENSKPNQIVEDNSASENVSSVQNDSNQNGLESNPQKENDSNVDSVNDSVNDENPYVDENAKKAEEKMLTQSQVNELVGKARKEGRESALKELMSRYGVYDEKELDSIFGRGQAYDDLDYDYKNQGQSYRDAMAENALLKSHIDESRWEDVKLILGGKGLEVNAENISALLPSHPEWNGLNQTMSEPKILTQDMAEQMVDNQYRNASNQVGAKKPGVLKKLGNEPEPVNRAKTEEEEAAELYGW